ncbi:predicted protein [Plenodomus lingam JN3]|uniref:Predicted protein n=1 Tax=Leptosphaeria maculans (strain JN3 / isolate v23.1.3 / race Av1-4-5-6-7-8) TaxID=985895 RepID=E4ZKC0_LEPMJ|nr:predicted protein [Plenodomus lingam JN3]CBX91715.1 predicted protein [Plenodomus lingam JN3]
MTKDHRWFHRRAARASPRVVTVNVEVVATVDTNGHTLAQETKPPHTLSPSQPANQDPAKAVASAAPVIPASAPPVDPPPPVPSLPPQLPPSALPVPKPSLEPAVPTVAAPALPSVPAVPPFPSNLVVPSVVAYPWPSGIPVAQSVGSSSSAAVVSSPNSAPQSSGGSSTPIPAISSLSSNSTSSLSIPSSAFSISPYLSLDSPSAASRPSSTLIPLSSNSPSASRSSSNAPFESSETVSDTATSTSAVGVGVGGLDTPAGPTAPSTTATTTASTDTESASAPLETPQVVGSVVGSLAGAAFILAIILLLLRRHKRKRQGALQLTGDDHPAVHEQSMTQAPTRNSAAPIAFLKRFSGISRSTAETSLSGGERSFQRVSGRKLPSAFSEGMTSEQFSRGGTISGSSFYQDDHGIYGGPGGIAKELGKEIGDAHTTRESGKMNIRPSPARTPVIRHPDEDPFADKTYLSPPQSPNLGSPDRGTLGRSLHSADGSRSSRFTENV